MYTIGMIALQGHCSTVALFRRGQLVWALSEERLSRIKEDSSLPLLSISECLRANQISIRDIEHISFAWNPWKSFVSMIRYNLKGLLSFDFIFNKRGNGQRSRIQKFYEMVLIERTIKNKFGFCPSFNYVDHHLSHVFVSKVQSKFDRGLCLVVDGSGESATCGLYQFENEKVFLNSEALYPHSIGIFYSTMTQFLGFTSDLDEYKVMGLAPYGRAVFVDEIRKLIQWDEKRFFQLNLEFFMHQKKEA